VNTLPLNEKSRPRQACKLPSDGSTLLCLSLGWGFVSYTSEPHHTNESWYPVSHCELNISGFHLPMEWWSRCASGHFRMDSQAVIQIRPTFTIACLDSRLRGNDSRHHRHVKRWRFDIKPSTLYWPAGEGQTEPGSLLNLLHEKASPEVRGISPLRLQYTTVPEGKQMIRKEQIQNGG